MSKGIWKVYFEQLEEIYNFLQGCECLFSLNEPFNVLGKPSGKYRGVFKLDQEQIEKINPMLSDGKRLYTVASEDSNRNGVPINFPKFLDDENVFKMQIHINKAHLSKNYEPDSNIKIASVDTMILPDYGESIRQQMKADIKALYQAEKDLEKLGYDVLIENLPTHDLMYIDVKTLCKLHHCASVQHRIDTGRQIRADYFSHDEDGNITKSKLQSIGILLIPAEQQIAVIHSHDRKIRTDAIYTKRHPTEIILKQIPENLMVGRLYRR